MREVKETRDKVNGTKRRGEREKKRERGGRGERERERDENQCVILQCCHTLLFPSTLGCVPRETFAKLSFMRNAMLVNVM